jgi:Glycosyltransferase family 87
MSQMRDRLLRDGYIVLAVVFLALRLFQVPPWDQSVDAYAYWSTRDGTLYDARTAGTIGAYLYSPAFAQLLAPLTWLPWPAFDTIWTAFNLAIVWWLLGRWSLPSMLFLPIPFEIVSGNVHLMYAAAIVAGFRFAPTWAFMFLTKVTPGIGVLWFAVRREWRPFVFALCVTGAIVFVSFALDPAAWRAWVDILQESSSTPATVGWYLPVSFLIRLPVALVVVGIAAWTDRRWLLPVGTVIAMPVLWLNSLAVLAACVPLASDAARRSSAPAAHHVALETA